MTRISPNVYVRAVIDKATAVPTLLDRLDRLEQGHCLEIRTYKRNRLVRFQRLSPDAWLVVRDGFGKARFEVAGDKLKKTLRSLLKKEFPRSTKIRVFHLGPCDPDHSRNMKRLQGN